MNQLKHEDSPYLQQHSTNPVWWWPWSDEAFLRAKEENKLIFLSIGYSTCHWCHVMERESFEDSAIAQRLNRDFISIKVDREEMPHIDKYYQDVHYILQRRGGGWPLTIIMLPNREVIFATTYLPKNNRNGMMGLGELLQFLHKKTIESSDEVNQSAKSIAEAIKRMQNLRTPPQPINESILEKFIQNIEDNFDMEFKGIGNAPKFPHASTFTALIEVGLFAKNKKALLMAREAYIAMAMGGICDQIEGGFYRYSVDERWEIPHFEKMLYTNAELLVGFSRLYANDPNALYENRVEGIINAMNEWFLSDGLYVSASDADSQGEEGRYFVFDYKDAKNALLGANFDEKNTNEILSYWHITPSGNFENKTTNPYCTNIQAPQNIEKAKEVLKKLRQKINRPFIDNKILTSWNALFITGLFEAGQWIDERYLKMGFKVLDKLLDSLHVKGVLYHQKLHGSPLKIKALLEDYAFLTEALVNAYSISGEKKYFNLARELACEAKGKFYKNLSWQLSDDGFIAKAPLEDASYKSAAATMMGVLLKIALIDGDLKLKEEVEKMVFLESGSIVKHPYAYPEMIRILLMLLGQPIALHVKKDSRKEALKKIAQNPMITLVCSDYSQAKACGYGSCFAEGKLDDVIVQINV
jgi:uncharacterized protein YyaL (SSP411 family)